MAQHWECSRLRVLARMPGNREGVEGVAYRGPALLGWSVRARLCRPGSGCCDLIRSVQTVEERGWEVPRLIAGRPEVR